MPLYSVNGHKEIINCIDGVGGLGIGEGAPEIATGSRDGKFQIYSILDTNKDYAMVSFYERIYLIVYICGSETLI